MGSFYTSAHRYGNNILHRGYTDNGTAIQERVKFSPSFFLPTKKPTPWHAMDGTPLEEKVFDDINAAKEFMDSYGSVSNASVHGTTNYVSQFLADRYPGQIKFNSAFISVANLDIEVANNKYAGNSDKLVRIRKRQP